MTSSGSPSEHTAGIVSSFHEAQEEDDLIRRLKVKVGIIPEDRMLEEGEHSKFKALLQKDKFEITEEQLEETIEEVVQKEHRNPHWNALLSKMLSVSCAFFAQEMLRGPPQPPYNGRFMVADHHMEWDRLLNESRLCVLAPRDHSKTFFFDFAYPIWKAWKHPGQSGFIFSASQEQAERILGDIKYELESNPKLQWLVPSRMDRWGVRQIRLSNGHRIYARGFGTKVRGAHPIWITVDDGLNDETAYSELVRTKQNDYFFTAISNMIVPEGQIIVVGTPFAVGDLYAELRENQEYLYRAYPAESNPGQPNNTALWSDRYSLDDLARKKREIGAVRYTREFLLQPMSDEMSLFPMHLFKGEQVEQFNLTLGMPLAFWKEAGVQIYMGVDFAMSSSVEADYTVVWTMGTDKFGNRWLIDIQRKKGLPYQEQLSLINQVARKYDPALIFLEDNQMQRIFGDELIRTSDLPIKKFTTGTQKHSLDKGVPSLRILLENGKFRIPRGDANSVELTDIWIEEMRNFTWDSGKLVSIGSHDDTVMALWICDQAIKQGGFQFSFGDEDDIDVSPQAVAALMKELLGEEESPESESPESDGGNGQGGGNGSGASGNLVDDDLYTLPIGTKWG